MMMWSSSRMSNNAAARATRSVSVLSCPLASGVPEGWLCTRISCVASSSNARLDDQPVVDDRAGHPALTDAVTLDNPVRRGEVDDQHSSWERRSSCGRNSRTTSSPVLMKSLPEPPEATARRPNSAAANSIRARFRPSPPTMRGGFGLVADTRQRTVVGRQHHFGQLFVVGEQGKQLAVAQGLHAPRRHFIEDILHKSRSDYIQNSYRFLPASRYSRLRRVFETGSESPSAGRAQNRTGNATDCHRPLKPAS